jgi:hypothetical protein
MDGDPCRLLGALDDPRRRPYFVFWTSADGDLRYGLKMAPTDDEDAVIVTLESGEPYRIPIERRPLPRGTGIALFYRCPRCRTLRRHLYLRTLVGTKLVDYLGLRCQVCAGLRFRSQGRYVSNFRRAFFAPFKGHRTVAPLPRRPWDPRAGSDPRLVAEELFQLEEARGTVAVGKVPRK